MVYAWRSPCPTPCSLPWCPAVSTSVGRPSPSTATRLEDVALGGWAYGPELGTAPVVVVVGGITASPFPLGDGRGEAHGGSDPWWPALFAPDLIDSDAHDGAVPVLARQRLDLARLRRSGATAGHLGARPRRSGGRVARRLGCTTPVTFVGASLGGMVGVAFAVAPSRPLRPLITISAGLRPDGWGTATRHLQRELVRDGAPQRRRRHRHEPRPPARHAHLPRPRRARHPLRQVRRPASIGRRWPSTSNTTAAASPSGSRCRRSCCSARRSIAASIGADPHARRAALERVTADTIVVGVPGDMLFPWALQVELHRELQAAGAQSSLWTLDSVYGHDAFLADQDRLADLLRGARAFGGAPRVGAAAALRGRRRRAGARAAHRHGRLRHRRAAACSR